MKRTIEVGSRNIRIYIAAAVMIGLVVSYIIMSVTDSPIFRSKEGLLDLTQIRVSENIQKLQGEWEFYWQELLSPEDIHHRLIKEEADIRWINIPRSWLGYSIGNEKLKGTGFATFRLSIQLNEQDKNELLALRVPSIFHAYKLWVNDDLLAEVGVVGEDKDTMTPQLGTRQAFFRPQTDRVEIVMQVANFHHMRGGITKYIELGGSEVITLRTNLKIAAEMFITASLLVIGAYHLLLFLLRRKDRAVLYFGIFTLIFGIRSLLVGELLIEKLWPAVPWELQFKLEYIILCSGVYFIMMYFDSIVPHYVSRWFHLTTRIVTSAFCIIIILTPAVVFTQLLLVIGTVIVLHMVYLIIGLIQAVIWRMEGALTFLTVSVIALVTVVNDFLYYSECSRIESMSPLGLLIFTIAQLILLSTRFTRAVTNEERVSRELLQANDQLNEINMNLERIVQERTYALELARDELQMSYDQLLHSEQGRKKLLAYITHDLRMPLSSMLGYVEAVQDKVKPERDEQYLKYIRDSTIRINRMIGELSFLSHLETGQVAFHKEPVHVLPFVHSFFDQYELIVRDAGLEFILDAGDEEDTQWSHAIIEMDAQRLEQALFNLLSNAMKFTAKDGQIRITLALDNTSHTRFAVIGIQDSGRGIPPEQLEHIFDRNYKYERPGMDQAIEGSGLGLAICREIVQAHGGTVRADSDGITGSVFHVSLPLL